MQLEHRFTVPAGIDATWAHFNDIAEVAGCFPGAVVTEADEQSFTGTVKVKLGPIALVYNGTGTFVEKDESAHRMVIDAKGKDKRGNGTAGAMVTATMSPSGPDATDVEVLTDLNITGKAAQFGRGNVMKDVSDKLLGQFVACLESRLAGADIPSGGPEQPAAAALPETEPQTEPDAGPEAAPETAVPPPRPTAATTPPTPPRPQPPRQDDALDLGAAVLPVLARTYWRQAAVGALVVALVVWLVGRRRS